MEALSAHDIIEKVGESTDNYNVVTPCLDNRFAVQYGKGKMKRFHVMRYHVGNNSLHIVGMFGTKHEARDFIFEAWAARRRTAWETEEI